MDVRHALELIGVAAFAASGVLSAARKGMDLIGVAAIAFVTALGGGTLRDLLLDRHPVFWIASRDYIYVCLGATVATLLWVRIRVPPYRALLVADALGLAFFVIAGTAIAQQSGEWGIVALLMGVMTGSAGGVIRDVLSAEIPLVLRPGRLYVSAAIAGAALYLVLEWMGVRRDLAGYAGMTVIATLRFISMRWNVRLPPPRFTPDEYRFPD
jgi:uncharacterized membrane protein YeiH